MPGRLKTASDGDPMLPSAEPAAAPAQPSSPPSSEKPVIGIRDGTGSIKSPNQGTEQPPVVSVPGDGSATAAPLPEFRPGEVIYASDPDGLVYEATVRRRLYGAQQQRQVPVGTVASVQEAEARQEAEAPTWHYFVHYHGWAVKWDHWISAAQVYPKTEASRQMAKRLEEEHKALMKEMSGGVSRKKQSKVIDAAAFYTEWRRRMERIYQAYHATVSSSSSETLAADGTLNDNKGTSPTLQAVAPIAPKPAKKETWSKAAVETELRLREKGLTAVYKHGDKILLADTLKRVLVDSWEIITQCGSVPDLPARVTVRDALNKYLESKGIVEDTSDSVVTSEGTTAALVATIATATTTAVEFNKIDNDGATLDSRQQWIDMRDGICMYFDETLPTLLLYPQEIPQLHLLHSRQDEEAFNKPYSEIYGTEHLLRLFTKLPGLMHGNSNEAELRPVLAKINDFVRFLQRDGSLFALNYRPYNELELKEKERMEKTAKAASRKRPLDTGLTVSQDCNSK